MIRSIFTRSLCSSLEGWEFDVRVEGRNWHNWTNWIRVDNVEEGIRFVNQRNDRRTTLITLTGDDMLLYKRLRDNMGTLSSEATRAALYLCLVKLNKLKDFINAIKGAENAATTQPA